MDKGATFSVDRVYRYDLWRIWDADKPRLNFICLNPSTADESKDDPTIRRCVGFAQRLGYGQMHMLNLFAFRATDPQKLTFPYCEEPIGPENDAYLGRLTGTPCIAGWGNWGELGGRAEEVYRLLPDLMCFGVTARGQPRHPLYLRKDAQLTKWRMNGQG